MLAFAGMRSGGILTYSGNCRQIVENSEPLKIDLSQYGVGMANTYAREIGGQTNHANNQMFFRGEFCEIILGDGTRRIYEKVEALPSQILGEELIPFLSNELTGAKYYHLIEETLPSGNHLIFSYNTDGHLSCTEMKNTSEYKTLSWMSFDYEIHNRTCIVKISTSDEKKLEYSFDLITLQNGNSKYVLKSVTGSHVIPCFLSIFF